MKQIRRSPAQSWLNRTVLGIALASLFSDWSHEIATAVLPAFLGSLGVASAWLDIIEEIAPRNGQAPVAILKDLIFITSLRAARHAVNTASGARFLISTFEPNTKRQESGRDG